MTHILLGGEYIHSNCVTGFVNSRGLQIPTGLYMRTLLRTSHNLHNSFVQILHTQSRSVATSRQNSSLIEQIAQICTGETCSRTGNDLQIHRIIQVFTLGMDTENLLTTLDIGLTHVDLSVKSTGTEQSRIQNIGTVGSCQNDYALGFAKAIHLYQ